MDNQSKITPKLVKDDAWLTNYTSQINERINQFNQEIKQINTIHSSLYDFASNHLKLGIHYHASNDQWIIREWAPNALNIQLIGNFNKWSGEKHQLSQNENTKLWEISLPGKTLNHKQDIKFRIKGADGSVRDRIPAYIKRATQDPITHDFTGQIWLPKQPYPWKHRKFNTSSITTPLIYEAHVGISGEEPRIHSYREFADNTIPYIKKAGYNVIQLMAIQEHPYYGSFGYHVSNFFAVSSRFGTPEDLKYLVDTAHHHGLAILLDVVHSHAVKNISEGLNEFDGTDHQYFHSGDKGNQPQWDSKCFNYSKPDVRQFLLSNTRYWLEEFKFDGFRFDGVTSMLYHHHGQTSFNKLDKYFDEAVDKDAILYLQLATTLTLEINPHAIIIAEDMSGMPGLCRPVTEGGIGFTHRLAMGIPDFWIKTIKESRDEEWSMHEIWNTLTNRRHAEKNISYAESHDQALVGDKTLAFRLMDKEMYEHMSTADNHPIIHRGIALHKIIRLLTFSLAGEGWLNFMGNEFGHPEWLDFPRKGNNWSYHFCRRQWSLTEDPKLKYQQLAEFDLKLLQLDKKHNTLAQKQAEQLWLKEDDKILAYQRGNLIFVLNIHPETSLTDYQIPIPIPGKYKIILNTDLSAYGGHDRVSMSTEHFTQNISNKHVLQLYIPCRTMIVLAQSEKSHHITSP